LQVYQKPLPPPVRSAQDEANVYAFSYYRDLIKSKGFTAKNHTEIPDGNPTSPEHLLWMCEHCIPLVRSDGYGMSVDKYSRWLGFVQGCLIMHGWTTVQAERDRTRPWFTN
jgi:hypothetical protein